MEVFGKLPRISGIRSIVKFLSGPRKMDPTKHFVNPFNRKILHALLLLKVAEAINDFILSLYFHFLWIILKGAIFVSTPLLFITMYRYIMYVYWKN